MIDLSQSEREDVANRRLRKRHQLLFNIAIIDTHTDEEIGRVVDISSEGIMLSSPTKYIAEHYSGLTFRLPEAIDGFNNIVFDAELRWHKQDANPQYELLGLQVVRPLSEYKNVFQGLIRKYSLKIFE